MTTKSKPVKPKKRRRIRRSKNSKKYFTQVHEDAIIEYCKESTSMRRREELYVRLLQPAFDQMVDKIVFTYKFTTLPNIDVLRDECKIWLVTVLDKYDKDKGSKAFSYFSVITKNWFIHKVKRQQKRNLREVDYNNISKAHEEEYLSTEESYVTIREEQEFWKSFYVELK